MGKKIQDGVLNGELGLDLEGFLSKIYSKVWDQEESFRLKIYISDLTSTSSFDLDKFSTFCLAHREHDGFETHHHMEDTLEESIGYD